MLLLVGANNAQGASVCQGNFNRPLRGGALQNIKFQAPNLKVSGVGCQVSGKRNIEAETSSNINGPAR